MVSRGFPWFPETFWQNLFISGFYGCNGRWVASLVEPQSWRCLQYRVSGPMMGGMAEATCPAGFRTHSSHLFNMFGCKLSHWKPRCVFSLVWTSEAHIEKEKGRWRHCGTIHSLSIVLKFLVLYGFVMFCVYISWRTRLISLISLDLQVMNAMSVKKISWMESVSLTVVSATSVCV